MKAAKQALVVWLSKFVGLLNAHGVELVGIENHFCGDIFR